MSKFVLLLLFCSVSIFAQSKKENSAVAVLEFQRTGAITNDDVQTLTNRFRAMLFQTMKFNVIERQKMKEILKEQEFILSDECSTNECAVQVGQLLGVEYMIAGDIGLIGDTYTIDLRMIDVSTGQLVQTHSKDHDGKIAGLLEIMKQIANSFSQFQKETAKMKADEKKATVSDAAADKNKHAIQTETKSESDLNGAKSHSKNLAFRLLIGSAIPSGKFNTRVKSGSNFMISCSYVLTSKLQAGIEFGSQTFKSDNTFGNFTQKTVPFIITGRYYTLLRRVKNYVALGFGTTKISGDYIPDKSFVTAKLGTGISYEIFKKLSAELALDFTNVGSKDKYRYNTTFTQIGLGLSYNLSF